MIQRFIEVQLQRLAVQFPVITITGPRQSGKTTLAQHYFKNYDYVNLEDPEVRAYAAEDPKGFLADHPAPLIIDEVQRVPELLSYIQVMADRDRKAGQYVLTGSHQPKLKAEISQSLAGRTGILQLLPLSIAELAAAGCSLERDALLHRGFMPKLYAMPEADAELEYSNYFATYVERDVRQLINLQHQHEFEVFVRLLAGRVGQLLNLNSLSDDIGVSSKTLKEWLNILEASYIVFRLPP
ncbi:MAG: ATP-binding protein, partial [Lentisphaeria bacterium]|nr:ATP-binding protein [Lentisphaeria bacterium]